MKKLEHFHLVSFVALGDVVLAKVAVKFFVGIKLHRARGAPRIRSPRTTLHWLKLELVVWQGGRPQKDVVMLVVVLFHSSVDMTKHQFMAQTKDISEKDLKNYQLTILPNHLQIKNGTLNENFPAFNYTLNFIQVLIKP